MRDKIILIIIIVALLGSVFYWFEWRPTQIKHDCSWVKKHTDAISARPGKSEEEIKNCEATGSRFCDLFAEPTSVQPAKDWWEKASKTEYDFCIHERGL